MQATYSAIHKVRKLIHSSQSSLILSSNSSSQELFPSASSRPHSATKSNRQLPTRRRPTNQTCKQNTYKEQKRTDGRTHRGADKASRAHDRSRRGAAPRDPVAASYFFRPCPPRLFLSSPHGSRVSRRARDSRRGRRWRSGGEPRGRGSGGGRTGEECQAASQSSPFSFACFFVTGKIRLFQVLFRW